MLPERVKQLAVLDRDLQVSPGRKLEEDPVGILHRKRALKRRLHRRQLPAPPERPKQLLLLGTLDNARGGSGCPRSADQLR